MQLSLWAHHDKYKLNAYYNSYGSILAYKELSVRPWE